MAVEVLDSCDMRPFHQSVTVKQGDRCFALLYVNHHESLTQDGWRLLQQNETGSLWSRPVLRAATNHK